MKYIVLDLEWNSAFYKPQGRFINEIIQIGAVKLDDEFNIIDKFQVFIKSQLVKKLSNRTINLTGITNDMMNSGIEFRQAVYEYNMWAGEDAVTMTWSNSDLYAIVENSRIFLDNSVTFSLYSYLDLQSYVQNELRLQGHPINNQISLKNAADVVGVSIDGLDLHNAQDDSILCAHILKKVFNYDRFIKNLRDAKDPSFFERLYFRAYYISNINDKRIAKNSLKFTCPQCKNAIKSKSKWKFKNNWHRAEFVCNHCNIKFRCMISFKQTYDKLVVKRRILPIINTNEVENVVVHQLSKKV